MQKEGALSLSGHSWTLWQTVDRRLYPAQPPVSEAWSQPIEDSLAGALDLTGRLSRQAEDRHLVILVHGLGGCAESSYLQRFAAFLATEGVSSLRFNLRGADQSGRDFYHAGLSSDLAEVMASPSLAHYETIRIVGFSLGGHVVLRYATHHQDPRLLCVAAICSPLHLWQSCADLDRPIYWLYRRYLFSGLLDMYAAMQPVYELPHSLERVRRVQTLREWDGLTVVPRFGFDDADDYYEQASVGPRLKDLGIPALLLATEGDPMVSARSIHRGLGSHSENLRLVWTPRGGHVAFPRRLDVGLGPRPGIEAQVWSWLRNPS